MKKVALSFVMGLIAILAMPNMVSAESSQGWTTITNNMKSDTAFEMLKDIHDDASNLKITVTSDDYKMVVEVSDDSVTYPYTYTYTFTYANDIVYYTSTNTSDDVRYAFIETFVINEFMQNVSEYYGYSAVDFSEWLDSVDSSTLTINDDGIEFAEYTVEESSEDGSISVTSMKSLKVNIECGISAFHENVTTPEVEESTPEPTPTPEVEESTPEPTPTPDVEETVENPNTGLYVSLGVLAVAVIGAITFVSSKKKNYFSKI